MSGGKAGSDGDAGETFGLPPLPRGRHRLSSDEVADNQRRRLLAAIAESMAVRGYAATSVERIIERAGVSRATFYEYFANRHECLLAAHQAASERFLSLLLEVCASQERWKDGAAAGIGLAVDFASESPEQARLLAVETIAADGEAARQSLAVVARLEQMLRSGRDHHQRATELPDVTERALVSAVAGAIGWSLLTGQPPADLKPQLIQLVLTPYLGPAAAARQAAKADRRVAERTAS